MKYVFAGMGILSMLVSALLFMGAKSAIHEILAGVGFLTAWVLIIGASIIRAVEDSSERAASVVVAAVERGLDSVRSLRG